MVETPPSSSRSSWSISWRQWQRTAARAVVPVVGLLLLAMAVVVSVFLIHQEIKTAAEQEISWRDWIRPRSVLIRLVYAALLTVGMEYVARYEHEYLWHSSFLWYFHASHHHQKAQLFGKRSAGMTQDNCDDNDDNDLKRKSSLYDTSIWERNDTFQIVFASLAILVLYWGVCCGGKGVPATAFRDVAVGSAVGISVYGTSYFIGHDLCAHQRAGPAVAAWLRRVSPTLARCAQLHVQYHHHCRNRGVSNGEMTAVPDLYGPPYGFWLGEAEVQAALKGHPGEHQQGSIRMPRTLCLVFTCALGFFVYSAYEHMQLVSWLE